MVKKQSLKTKEQLLQDIEELESRLFESEEALNAIRNGEVDAIIVSGQKGEKIFSLTSAETPYRIILEEMSEGAIVINSYGNILYSNQSFADLFFVSIKHIIGSNIKKFVSGADKQKLAMLIEEGHKGKTSGMISCSSNLKKKYFNFSLRPLSHNSDRHICIIVSDVTKMQQSQDQLNKLIRERTLELEKTNLTLRESEERFRSILNNSQDVIYRMNLQTGCYEYISPSCEKVTGFLPEELLSLHKNESNLIVHPESVAALESARKLALKTGKGIAEYRQVAKDGSYHWLSNHMSLIRDRAGKPLYRDGYIRDITERKNAEIKLRQAQEKLTLALDHGKIGTWEWDLIKDEVIWGERTERMFGLAPGTFGGTFKAFEDLVHEEDISHIQKSIKDSIEKDIPLETILRSKPRRGKVKYISATAELLKDKDGKPVSLSGICLDVTSLKEGTELLVSKLNEELLKSNKELENFAYVASHDLQEPLRMVSSFTQLLDMQYGDRLDDNAREYIGFAVDGARRMYDLLNGLLAYSRIQTRGREFRKVDLNNVLKIVTKNLTLAINERNVLLKTDELPQVFADESQMIILFQNLISNSIKFSPESPRIFINAETRKGHYIFSVKDEGMGIDKQYFERIFKIFQRLVTRAQFQGTGIGLALCKRIVERHGGEIWVESTLGNGATFFFTIPKKANSKMFD